jgi:flagellar hook-associated protein 2
MSSRARRTRRPKVSISISSISLDDYLTQSLAYLRLPITNLEEQRSEFELKSAVFTDLDEKLSALEDVLDRMTASAGLSLFRQKVVTSSADGVVTATATGAAVSGSHKVFVTQLAKAHTVVSNRYDQEGTDLSAAQSGTKTFSITLGEETYDVSVDISAGDTNSTVLAQIATAINDATDGEIVASFVMDTPSTGKISIRSGSTGTAGSMSFTDTDGLLGALGVTNGTQATDTVGGYVYADLGGNELDAKLTVDGINVISSDNVVENVIGGVTLTLLAEQEDGDAEVSLTVAVDTETIRADLEEFLEAYNEVFTYVKEKTRVDGVTYERGVLAGDFPYVSLRISMRGAMTTYVGSASSDFNALSQIGITSDRSGDFSITDSSLLEEAIVSNPEGLEALFNEEGGIAASLASLIAGYTEPGGTIANAKEGVDARIDLIDDSIERQEKRLEMRESDLRNQYAALQEALYSLQQTSSMTDLFSSILGL